MRFHIFWGFQAFSLSKPPPESMKWVWKAKLTSSLLKIRPILRLNDFRNLVFGPLPKRSIYIEIIHIYKKKTFAKSISGLAICLGTYLPHFEILNPIYLCKNLRNGIIPNLTVGLIMLQGGNPPVKQLCWPLGSELSHFVDFYINI